MSISDLAAALAALDPPPTSANDAAKRIGGNRARVLAAYRQYRASTRPRTTQRQTDATPRQVRAWWDDEPGWRGIR